MPTPPAFAPPLEPLAGTWRPWHLRRPDALRPPPPPVYLSPAHLAGAREVLAVSRSLTAQQREIALFWNDGAGTETPPGHWNRIALELIAEADLTAWGAARTLAALNTAQADAFIACWDAKFTYWTKRPVTVIRERVLDPDFTALIPTPPFPAYPSGHATTSGAAATVLAALFPRSGARLQALADEAALSRLYGGIHFRSDNEAGLALGRRVGREALRDGLRGHHVVPGCDGACPRRTVLDPALPMMAGPGAHKPGIGTAVVELDPGAVCSRSAKRPRGPRPSLTGGSAGDHRLRGYDLGFPDRAQATVGGDQPQSAGCRELDVHPRS